MRSIIYTFDRLWARTVWTSAVINCLDITWSSSFKKKLSYISVQLSLRTLIYHSNVTQTFISHKRRSSARLSSSNQMSLQKIAHQKIKELSVFSKVWWDSVVFCQVWWVAFVTLMRWRFRSSSLMSRFRHLMRWRFHSSSLMSRSRQS